MLALAICLSALAGFVDVVAFASLGGFFASFMSGNTTRLAIGIGGRIEDAILAASLIGSFLAGIIGATVIGHRAGERRGFAILVLVTALLVICALIARPWQLTPLLLLAAAMGAMNCLFDRGRDAPVGLTYMTGTIVRFGQNIARWIERRATRDEWVRPLLLWLSFLGGGLGGIGLYWRINLQALWIAAALAASLAAALWFERKAAP